MFMNEGASPENFTYSNCQFLHMFLETHIHKCSFVYNSSEKLFRREHSTLYIGPKGIYVTQPYVNAPNYNYRDIVSFFTLTSSNGFDYGLREYASVLYAFRFLIDAYNSRTLIPNNHKYLV